MTTDKALPETNAPDADEAAVRGLFGRMIEGWNRGNGAEFAAAFAGDGELVAFDGTRFRGRAEISAFHQELFDRWMKGTRLVGRIESVRFLGPDVALMHAVGGTVMRGKTEPSAGRDSIQTYVAARENGEWRLAAFQNTRVRPINGGVSFLIWTLTDLLWRIFRPGKGASRG